MELALNESTPIRSIVSSRKALGIDRRLSQYCTILGVATASLEEAVVSLLPTVCSKKFFFQKG